MKAIRLIPALLATAALLTACASPQLTTPKPLPLSDDYANASLTSSASIPDLANWWQGFKDPVLDKLVVSALAENLDLKTAVSRIDAARALRAGAAAQGLPDIGLTLDAGRQRQSAAQAPLGFPSTANTFGAGLDAAWEIDIFGRIRQGVVAADADVRSAQESAQAVRIAVTAEVVQTYLAARSLEYRLALVSENARNQTETEKLTRLVFEAGALPLADVDRAQAQAQTTLAQLPLLELERQNALHRLSILVAATPKDVYEQMEQLSARKRSRRFSRIVRLCSGQSPRSRVQLLRRLGTETEWTGWKARPQALGLPTSRSIAPGGQGRRRSSIRCKCSAHSWRPRMHCPSRRRRNSRAR